MVLQRHTSNVQVELVDYGKRLAAAHLTAGTGGNISAREGDIIWMKPSGYAFDEVTPDDLCALHLESGKIAKSRFKPTSEYRMHLAVYRARPDVHAAFHVHPPWLTGVISSGRPFEPTVAEYVYYLGRVGILPYIKPTSRELAQAVAGMAPDHDTILMPHHGLLALGKDMREALHRCLVAEDVAKSMVAAAAVGTLTYLTETQVADLHRPEPDA